MKMMGIDEDMMEIFQDDVNRACRALVAATITEQLLSFVKRQQKQVSHKFPARLVSPSKMIEGVFNAEEIFYLSSLP